MKFDISMLELDAVLVALHTAARVNNTTFLDNKVPTLTHRMARELIEEGQATGELKFDRLMGRALNIDLNDDLVDLTRYGINNGYLTGVQALYKLCSSQGLVPLVYLDEQEDPVVVTDEWLHRNAAIHNDDVRFAYPAGMSSAPATTLDDKGMQRLEAEFVNRKQQLIDNIVGGLSDADKTAWQARWDAASPEERNRILQDDTIKYAYPHMSETQILGRIKRPDQAIVEVGSPMDLLLRSSVKDVAKSSHRLSRSDRMELQILGDDNADRKLLGRDENPAYEMALRMAGDQIVSIDVVRDSAIGRASDFDGSVDMSKPVDKGFGA